MWPGPDEPGCDPRALVIHRGQQQHSPPSSSSGPSTSTSPQSVIHSIRNNHYSQHTCPALPFVAFFSCRHTQLHPNPPIVRRRRLFLSLFSLTPACATGDCDPLASPIQTTTRQKLLASWSSLCRPSPRDHVQAQSVDHGHLLPYAPAR